MRLKVARILSLCVVPLCAAAQDRVVKIGHVAPLSGVQGSYGKDNQNGAQLAIDDLNGVGVVIGGKKVKFELLAEDDAADPKQAVVIAKKMCNAKVAGVVGHYNSDTSIPASKIYSECGMPNITPSATNPKLTESGYRTTWRILANDNALGAGLAYYAATALKLKRIAVIDDGSAYGRGIAEIFKKTILNNGVIAVDEQSISADVGNFNALLTVVKSKAPDGIFFGGFSPQAGPMLRQMEQLGLTNVKYFGGDGICSNDLFKQATGAKTLDNVICAQGGASLAKMPGGDAWMKRYEAKYPRQFQLYSPYVYDAVHVLVDAMKRSNSVDPKVYGPIIGATNFKGITTTVQFETNGELKNPAVTLYAYKGDKKIALN